MDIPEFLIKHQAKVENELSCLLANQTLPLYRMMQYQMGWVDNNGDITHVNAGKRLRSSMCLLACQVLGGDVSVALPSAAAVEMVHNFSLIHDDVQDGSPQRHNRSTVWWLWGPAQAINAGDGMHALARLSLLRQRDRGMSTAKVLQAIQYLDDACLRLCEGQYMDLSYQERIDITEHQYFTMVEAKAGALMGCASQLGALMATNDQSVIDAFYQCGYKLGVAFQIRNDILDLWGSTAATTSMPASNVLNKKKPLPVVYALCRGSIKQKREIGTVYFKRVIEREEMQRVIAVLDEMGAREYTQREAERLGRECRDILEKCGISSTAMADIQSFADYLVHWEE